MNIAAIRRHKKIFSLLLLVFFFFLALHFLAHVLDPDHGQDHTECLLCHFFKLLVLIFTFAFFLIQDTKARPLRSEDRFFPNPTIYLPYRRRRGPPSFSAC